MSAHSVSPAPGHVGKRAKARRGSLRDALAARAAEVDASIQASEEAKSQIHEADEVVAKREREHQLWLSIRAPPPADGVHPLQRERWELYHATVPQIRRHFQDKYQAVYPQWVNNALVEEECAWLRELLGA